MKYKKVPKYAKISLKRRLKLIQLTSNGKTSISKAAKMLGLKPSTAKLIVKRYRQEGTFFQSKWSKKIRLERVQRQQVNRTQLQNVQQVEQHGTSYLNNQNGVIPINISSEIPSGFIIRWSPSFQNNTWVYPYGFSHG